jgi:hypothetical protein
MQKIGRTGLVLLVLLAVPLASQAQNLGTIAGLIKDASDAVLPGVSVEVASPALIEKTRSVVSDGAGQYAVVSLPVGTYSVTFTLAGFNTYLLYRGKTLCVRLTRFQVWCFLEQQCWRWPERLLLLKSTSLVSIGS